MNNTTSKEEIKKFTDEIMKELNLKGPTKKRMIKTLAEQCDYNKQKVLFKLKRALISERYQAHKTQ